METKKRKSSRRPNQDGTVYYDANHDRWIGQLSAVRRWDGSIQRRSVSGKSREEVIERKRRLEAELQSPQAVDPSKIKVKDWVEIYFKDFKEMDFSPTTTRDYRSIIDNYVIPLLGEQQVQRVTPLEIQRILNAARTRGLSSGRIIKIANVLSSLFGQARRAKVIAYNPASAEFCKRPRMEKTYEEQVPNPEIVASFLKEAAADPISLAVSLSLAGGFRRGELLGLKWCNINFESDSIIIRDTVVEGEHGKVVKGPKSKAGLRPVIMPKLIMVALASHKDRQTMDRKSRKIKGEPVWVFETAKGTPITPSNFSRSFRQKQKAKGISGLRLKTFRHTQATLLDEINAPLKVRQERMGHAQLKTTLQVYTHTQESKHRHVAEELNKVLEEILNSETHKSGEDKAI